MGSSSRSPSERLIAFYYGLTLVFVLLDFVFSFNVRLTFLDDSPLWRGAYYLFTAGCFALVWRFPAWSNVVAAGESLLNLSALIISMALRVVIVDDAMLDTGRGAITLNELINFALSGSAGYLALTVHSRAAHRDLTR